MLRLVAVKVLLQMRARVGGGARNTAQMSASPDLRRRRMPSATVVLGLGPSSGGGGGGAGSGGGSSRGGSCGDAGLDGEDEAMKYSGGECRWKTNENTKAAANFGEKLASAARTRGIGTHLRVGERQMKREEPRRGGGAHVVGEGLDVGGERRGVVVDGAGGDAEGEGAGPGDECCGLECGIPALAARRRDARPPPPPPTPPVGGEARVLRAAAAERRAAACDGGEAPRVAPPVLNPTGFGLFFFLIQ
ncbi:hypothetical protein PVAP13_9NG254800 [Panicum virgatum]|uniref:Uncharacterized protein n=1 Tax=Panicum virgatum TaxID=38727 RepID=A0A8T0MPD8_PANVG|nr:hypothetical protein PVAP13_9NG254800 [Panicum virgatum]